MLLLGSLWEWQKQKLKGFKCVGDIFNVVSLQQVLTNPSPGFILCEPDTVCRQNSEV